MFLNSVNFSLRWGRMAWFFSNARCQECMKFRIFLPVLLLSGFSSSAMAASLDCSKLPPNSVEIVLAESGIKQNYAYSFLALKGMTERYGDQTMEVLGLTVGNAVVRTEIQSSILQDAARQLECSTHQVNIKIGFEPLTVYVGKEFPQGSCGFKEIYAHEMRHAEIYREFARKAVAEASEPIRNRITSLGPLRGAVGSTQERIATELNERWVPYVKRLLNRAEAQQRGVDTREEYDRVASSCEGEILKVIKRVNRP
jgi:hypothetical protein